jgi:hypothetical protein
MTTVVLVIDEPGENLKSIKNNGLLFIRESRLDYVQHSLGDQLVPDWRDMGCVNPNE